MITGKKRILLVDDEVYIIELLKAALEPEGFETLEANDGIEALAVAAKDKPDLIVLDNKMPNMPGSEVCKKLREESNPVPILMLSAHVQESEVAKLMALGANAYLKKPFSIEDLAKIVKKMLNMA